jgi:hypothetical protein
MAEQQQNPGVITNTFSNGMVKDYNETFVGEGLYTHARNVVSNSHDGQLGVKGNEPANLSCITLPYSLIGCIHLSDDQWSVYTTDDTNSEIGIFDESQCTYTKVVNDPCLGFKRSNLITGASRKRYDCDRPVYWVDALNPDRFMDLSNPPFKYTETIVDGCKVKTITQPLQLDCEKIRLASLIQHPCLILNKGKVAGTLPNGSYQVAIAYTEDGVRLTGYIGISEVQSLFTHENVSSSLELSITTIDTTFDEFELVVIGRINGTTVVKKIGNYSTSQGKIYIDRWDQEFETVPISQVVFRGDSSEKSDAIYEVNNYLLKIGDYSKFKFNYQKQANNINVSWTAVQYPSNYYFKGGNNTGYLRDEQYSFFIRWVYNTGERSESYHIPGRDALASDRTLVMGDDAFETSGIDSITRERWQVYNTATLDNLNSYTLSDGGLVIASGKMGFWESTEKYPDNTPDIWGTLCGKNIRHHKMPDETTAPSLNLFSNNGKFINILGVNFSNITHPLDNQGNPIQSIVGYELLRGSREGNKSIIGKGLLNNMREYSIPNQTTKGLFQNYPYNDLRPDPYLTDSPNLDGQSALKGQANVSTSKMSGYKKNIFSFHSPDVTFSNPFLNANELTIYQEVYGESNGRFVNSWKHPKFKVLSNFSSVFGDVASIISTVQTALGALGGGLDLKIEADKDAPVSTGLTLNPNYAGDTVTVFGSGASPLTIAQFIAAGVANGLLIGALIGTGILPAMYKQQYLRLFIYLIPKKQYSAQYNSHGVYDGGAIPKKIGNKRRKIKEALYIGSGNSQFNSDYFVNNTARSNVVVLETEKDLDDPTTTDNSRVTLGEANSNLYQNIKTTISSHYGALKISIPSQYGQLGGIKQFPINGGCIFNTTPDKTKKFNTSSPLFNGDTYINKFTEKNTMFFFTDWMIGEPDRTEWDYTLYMYIPYPRFWINNVEENVAFLEAADNYRSLDKRTSGFLHVSSGYFYLFNSGVREFFVESEVNLAYRDWEEDPSKRHYDSDRYTDLDSMFRSDIIKSGNFYKYDYNLSVSKLFNSHITWGNILGLDYDPTTAEKCYVYRPSRVRYSLPQFQESKKDNWRIYLTNNYKDFDSPVTSIKSVNKTGALFMMSRQSPMQFMGVEELKLDGTGAKITIGDGGLFNQPLQQIVNTESSFEYGSCQSKYCSINTIHGVFWVSQNQGKIFQYAGQIKEISKNGLKWWFARYLPSELLAAYPTYPYFDNPVIGVGVQIMYDNTNEIVYITKKDYKPLKTNLLFDSKGFYEISSSNGKVYIPLTNTSYFEDASWTISYDPNGNDGKGAWVSFHDWIPSFLIPGKAHFMSVNQNSIWKHNVRCDKFCNFYGVDYPFEIEFISSTGQQVVSMRNVEYILEAYKIHNECRDEFHVLDANFDQAIIYNSEQVSGLLELELKNKTNPVAMLSYPQIRAQSIGINYSKEEQKIRFNQFWDITKERGEFATNTNIPMFITEPNGYKFKINPAYVNYQKSPLERKKFRHNLNKVFLRKFKSDDIKMLFKISNQKIQLSQR